MADPHVDLPPDSFMLEPRRCELCRHWAQWMQERMLGLCGHPDSAGVCTDKWETCSNFEAKE